MRNIVAARAAARHIEHLRQTPAHGFGGERCVLRAHVRIAHQYDRAVPSPPGEDFEAVLVVVIVRALALRHVSPASGDMARRVHVLEKVQRERLVDQRGTRERAALVGRQLLVGESARLLQRAQVIPAVDPDGVEHRAGPQCEHAVLESVQIRIGAREQEMREVGIGAARILWVGALHSGIGGAQRVHPLRATRLVCEAPLCVADRCSYAPGLLRRRGYRNAREILLQLRGDVGDDQNPVGSADRLDQVGTRTGVIARNRRQCRPVDAGRRHSLLGVGTRIAQARLVADSRVLPQSIEYRPAFGVQSLNREHRDVAVLRIDPCGRPGCRTPGGGRNPDAQPACATPSFDLRHRPLPAAASRRVVL